MFLRNQEKKYSRLHFNLVVIAIVSISEKLKI